jgi:hypothetical protein
MAIGIFGKKTRIFISLTQQLVYHVFPAASPRLEALHYEPRSGLLSTAERTLGKKTLYFWLKKGKQ